MRPRPFAGQEDREGRSPGCGRSTARSPITPRKPDKPLEIDPGIHHDAYLLTLVLTGMDY